MPFSPCKTFPYKKLSKTIVKFQVANFDAIKISKNKILIGNLTGGEANQDFGFVIRPTLVLSFRHLDRYVSNDDAPHCRKEDATVNLGVGSK